MMDIDQTTANEVFAAAANGHWVRTNLGLRSSVSYHSETWTVEIPPARRDAQGNEIPQQAQILGSEGYGGTSFAYGVFATWLQTMVLVDAAMGALRLV